MNAQRKAELPKTGTRSNACVGATLPREARTIGKAGFIAFAKGKSWAKSCLPITIERTEKPRLRGFSSSGGRI